MQRDLSFGDGFQFGCGFFVAWIVGSIVFSILLGLLVFILMLLRLIPGFGSLGGAGAMLWIPALL